ncbi:allantoinase PuuE [Agrobacterium rhizogenes]|nr:allantoinase PuuE [Rhizobium rhizogenes]
MRLGFTSDDRDWIGYGRAGFDPRWPNDAHLAVQFVINYEEGGERNILDGDEASEARLSEIIGAEPQQGQRNRSVESLFEYGARAGFWRLWRIFRGAGVPVTVFGVTEALRRNPDAVQAMLEADWEIACHGLRWLPYRDVPEEIEMAYMDEAIRLHTRITGGRPLGWYTGAQSERTTNLVIREGGFLYSSDSYADDLPYWVTRDSSRHLVVPYAFDTNDVKFVSPQGFNSGDQFFTYLRDTFDFLYAEGKAGAPKMMSVGLHCRIAGRAGRAAALSRFLNHLREHQRVWITRRIDIARHWHDVHA